MAKKNELMVRLSRLDEPPLFKYVGGIELTEEKYIGLTELLSNQFMKITPQQLVDMRKGTYDSVRNYLIKNNLSDFKTFWNENVKYMKNDINKFLNCSKIAPIAHLIECFEFIREVTTEKNNSNSIKYYHDISFCLKFEYFEKYAKTKKVPKSKNKMGAPSSKNRLKYKDYFAKIDDSTPRIKCPQNPIYEQWRLWCKINKTPISNGLLMAMQCLLEKYPNDEIPNKEKFEVKSLDTREEIKVEFDKRINILINNNVYSLMKTIIKNYNDDVENSENPHLSMSKYINNAIDYFNKNKISIKYSSPQTNKEIIELQKNENFLQSVLNK